VSSVQQQLAEVVAGLPDDCTLEDFRYHFYLRQKMEDSMRDIEEGRVHTPEEAAEVIKSWRKSSDRLGPERSGPDLRSRAERTRSVDRAEEYCLNLLATSVDRLQRLPDSGSLVSELAHWQAREIYRDSYRIIYVHRDDVCYVNMCMHASRHLARHTDRRRWDNLPL
jgi:plasmid stabilization system protein ParE